MSTWNCCRTCLGTATLSPIFPQTEYSEHYTNVIFIVTGVKVELNDALPQELCHTCITFINDTMKFRKKCELSQTTLGSRLTETHQIKLEYNEPDLAIDISEYIDDNFKDYDDNTTLNNIKYNEAENLHTKSYSEIEKDTEIEKVDDKNHIDSEIDDDFKDYDDNIALHTLQYNKPENLDMKSYSEIDKVEKDTEVVKVDDKNHIDNEKIVKDVNNDVIKVNEGKKEKVVRKKSKRKEENEDKVGNQNEIVKDVNSDVIKVSEGKKEKVVKKKSKKKEENGDKVKEEIECEYCHKILKSKLSVRNHYKIHTGFDVVCEHCGKKFITRRLLLMHCRAKHGYEKTDKCSFCDYRASNAEQVKIHERLHTGEKPYVCAECGVGFHRKSSYLQHVAIHLPEKTVQCPVCPARFKSVTLMRIHSARHRAPRYSYLCALCDNTFARRRNVARHVQRIHLVPPEPHTIRRRKIA